ncbi:hypothetical protein ACJW30_10G092100 [Castanea mollissima]
MVVFTFLEPANTTFPLQSLVTVAMTENLGPTAASTFIFKPCLGGELQPKANAETRGLVRGGLALLCSTKRLKILVATSSKFMSMFSNTEWFLCFQITSQRMAPNNKKSSLWLGNRLFTKFGDKRKLTNSNGDSKFKTSILNPHWLWYHKDLEKGHTMNRCKVVSTAKLQRGQHKSILSLNLLIISLEGSKLAAILQRSILKPSCNLVF